MVRWDWFRPSDIIPCPLEWLPVPIIMRKAAAESSAVLAWGESEEWEEREEWEEWEEREEWEEWDEWGEWEEWEEGGEGQGTGAREHGCQGAAARVLRQAS